MKLQDIDFRVWSKQEKKYLSNPFLMRRMPIIDCLGEINTEAICGEYSFVENKNNESILTRFSRFLKQFQKTRIIAPSNFAKSLTYKLIPKNNIVENNMELELELWCGFYDKNLTKIYEGDIVAHYAEGGIEYYSKVVFNQDKGAFEFVCIEHPVIETFDKLANSDIQILGNIHENPELLESGAYLGNYDCRIWDKKRKIFFYGYKNNITCDETEIELFTKYKDRKNEQNVFANDIIIAEYKRKRIVGVIKKDDKVNVFNSFDFSLVTKTDTLKLGEFIIVEVIGNIHWNPELLELLGDKK